MFGCIHGGQERLSSLLQCAKWSAELIQQFLWQRASDRLAVWKDAGLDALAIWDESVWEKPESITPKEFGTVRSSKATRLTHIKKGYYTPPRGPVFVPGLRWKEGLLKPDSAVGIWEITEQGRAFLLKTIR